MDPINFAGPAILAALISLATLQHWDMRARGMGVRHFGACSAQWREATLRRSSAALSAL